MMFGLPFFREVGGLLAPFWLRRNAWLAWAELMFVLVGNLAIVGLLVWLTDMNRELLNALEKKDADVYWAALIKMFGVVVVFVLYSVWISWTQKLLQITWRDWMTQHLLDRWMADQKYYRLELDRDRTDNPDQRIAEDIREFINLGLDLFLGAINAVATLVGFLTLLWHTSGVWDITLFGQTWEIYGVLVWIALGWSLLTTLGTHFVGRAIVPVTFRQQHLEANFRFHLVRMRENAESIAFYRGERDELTQAKGKFGEIVGNFRQLIMRERRLASVTIGISQLDALVPLIVSVPRYFAGKIQLGDITQTSSAYSQVSGALMWLMNSYLRVAHWRAATERLLTFTRELDKRSESKLQIQTQPASQPARITLQDVRIELPTGRVLIDDLDGEIPAGSRLLIQGPSGSGKSTLFRMLAGLWPYGQGRITLPDDASRLFIPQKPYLPIGTLRAALCYPQAVDAFDDAKLTATLGQVGLAHLAAQLDESAHWSQRLSGGEQQRLAFARALLIKPRWLFMDEATSAVDDALEQQLYQTLLAELPETTIVSIAHRSGARSFHGRVWTLSPQTHQVVQA